MHVNFASIATRVHKTTSARIRETRPYYDRVNSREIPTNK